MPQWLTVNRLIVIVIVIIAAIGGGAFLLSSGPSEANTAESEIVTVARETFYVTVDSTGEVEPNASILLAFDVSGQVETVNVEVGDTVEAGQVLAVLDTTDLEYQVQLAEQNLLVQQTRYNDLFASPSAVEIAQAQANVAQAQASLQSLLVSQNAIEDETTSSCVQVEGAYQEWLQAQADYDDYLLAGYEMDATFQPSLESAESQSLLNSEAEYERLQAQCNITINNNQEDGQIASAEASLASAEASLAELQSGPSESDIALQQSEVTQAEIQLAQAQSDLANAVIIAPFGGVITAVDILPGQLVNSISSVITLAEVSQLHLEVQVDEIDVMQVALGQEVQINLEALDETSIAGEVISIAPAGANSEGLVVYEVRIALEDIADYDVRLGMTADAEIRVRVLEDVLVVPSRAIQRDGAVQYLEIQTSEEQTRRVEIETGYSNAGLTVIESGDVSEGAEVIVPVREASNNSDTQAGPPGLFGN